LGAKIVLLGDDTEKPIADVISNAMRNKPLDLTGKLGLDLLPAVIKNCSLFISNDGGPMHIAAALGIKTVSIFGPVSEVVYGPYPAKSGHAVLKWDLDCRPCYRNFRMPVCDKDKECLRAISVDAVFEAAAQLLRQGEK
jgi:heptosyltransferase-2